MDVLLDIVSNPLDLLCGLSIKTLHLLRFILVQ